MAQRGFERTVEVFVRVGFGALAGQMMQCDHRLVFFQQGFCRVAVMQPQVVEDEMHFTAFRRVRQRL